METSSKNILIVDDSETVRSQLREALESAGYSVVEAQDGVDGSEKAAAHSDLALIIADVNMPKMDGIEMCSRIKSDPKNKDIPIIMLTTERDPVLKDRAKTLGVKAWIIKPFNKESTLAGISKLLSKSSKAA